jgi:catechol 2,3-dioxygenase-like lactoylglutathione lyase family enzyme
MIERLDHINIRTARLQELIDWYGRVLGLLPGRRPDFPFAGAWLYAGTHALVHLVEVADASDVGAPERLQLEHGAFSATGLGDFLALLSDLGERHRLLRLPGMPVVQVNVWDPDGNHLHVDFNAAEADGLDIAV